MLKDITDVTNYTAVAEDGEVGRLEDILFDDGSFSIRYIVVHTGDWLTGRKILVPPNELGRPDWSRGQFPISLTRKQIEEGPTLDTDEPVSRQHEEQLQSHFGWQASWTGEAASDYLSDEIPPGDEQTGDRQDQSVPHDITPGDPDLRSFRETLDYRVEATDGNAGHVEGFIIDDEDWMVRYLIVRSQDLEPERRLLLSVEWIDKVLWDESTFFVDMDASTIRKSPTYDPSVPITRPFEEALHDHYELTGYWQASGEKPTHR